MPIKSNACVLYIIVIAKLAYILLTKHIFKLKWKKWDTQYNKNLYVTETYREHIFDLLYKELK